MIASGTPAFWRATLALCLGSVIVFSNLYITQPLLPLLQQSFSITPLQASATLSVTTLTLGIFLVLFGSVSDAIGRRIIILSTLVLLCVTTLMTALASGYTQLLILRALQGVFIAGLPATAMAYMGEEFEPGALLFAVGLYIGANSLGGVSGRLISGWAASHWGWESSFLILGIFDLVCLLVVAWLLPASNRFQPSRWHPGHMLGHYKGHLVNPAIVVACAISGLNFLVFVNQYSYITFVLAAAPYELGPDWIGMLFLTYLTGTLAAGFSGRLVAGRAQPLAMATGILLIALGSLLTLIPHLVAIVAGFFVNAFGFFFAHSQAAGWVTRHARTARASATSLYLTFYYAGATLGGFYLAPFWRWTGWSGVVAGSLVVLGVSLWLALWLRRWEKHDARFSMGSV